MLTKVTIKSFNGDVNLSVYVPRQKSITKTLSSAYTKLASVADLSFCFWQALYFVNGCYYSIDVNVNAHHIVTKH